jgi:predicted transcriptional regulator
MSQEMILFFKALADSNRLKIIGLLARQSYSVEELAALLNLKASTISHHLSKLAEVGLVTARAEGYYSVYQLDRQALKGTARSLFSDEQIAAIAKDVDLEAYDRKVLANFSLPDGSLKEIPAQRKKLEVILRYVLKAFQPDVKYTEKHVNEILSRFHEDTATLQRELVGFGLMKRDGWGGSYWVSQEI